VLTHQDLRVATLARAPRHFSMPPQCACCGQPAARSRAERRAYRSVIVPYCEGCLRHASQPQSRELAAALAGCVLGGSAALLAPVVFERAPLALCVLLSFVLAAAPALLFWLVQPRPAVGHSSGARAVWWLADGRLALTHAAFASAFARDNDATLQLTRRRPPPPTWWVALGMLLAVVIAPIAWSFFHPRVRVLNLSDQRLEIWVDGDRAESVAATSAESAAAGAVIRVPAGRREIRARSADGTELASASALVEAGGQHLYAPLSEDYCFWLERDTYGRQHVAPRQLVALTGASRFWTLPEELTSWFAPNPPVSAVDARSTGGQLLALRQARCVEAPAEVSQAAGR
jgi:hypothetical protein